MVPKSAVWDRVVPGGGGADIGVPLNYSTHSNGEGRAAEDGLWYRGLLSGTV